MEKRAKANSNTDEISFSATGFKIYFNFNKTLVIHTKFKISHHNLLKIKLNELITSSNKLHFIVDLSILSFFNFLLDTCNGFILDTFFAFLFEPAFNLFPRRRIIFELLDSQTIQPFQNFFFHLSVEQ